MYLVFILFLGSTCQRLTLLKDYMIAVRVSAVKFLLLAGVYVSSMSSCLGAMYGTPRVLQSIALENVIPGIGALGKGVKAKNDFFYFSSVSQLLLSLLFVYREVQIRYHYTLWA